MHRSIYWKRRIPFAFNHLPCFKGKLFGFFNPAKANARFKLRAKYPQLNIESPSISLELWRPALAGLCTPIELETVYSYDDLEDMHEALNYREYCEEITRNQEPS